MLALRTLALLGLLFVSCSSTQERAPGVRRAVYVLEVELERARAIRWAPKDATDEQVLESAAGIVRRRLAAMERSFQVRTGLEGRRIELAMPQIQPRDRELFEDMLRSLGSCELLFLADEELVRPFGVDLEAERKKLETWRASNVTLPLEVFNSLPAEQQGPHPRILWLEADLAGKVGPLQAMLLPDKPEDHVGVGSFERIYLTQDSFDHPGLGFELKPSRVDDFARLTEAHVHHRLGFVLEGKLRSALTLETKLIGGGVFEGDFKAMEIDRLTESIWKHATPLRVEIR